MNTMKPKLAVVAQNTLDQITDVKLYQRYLRDVRNAYLSFEEWREQYKPNSN